MLNLNEVSRTYLEPDVPIQEDPDTIAEERVAVLSHGTSERRPHHSPDLYSLVLWVLDHGQAGDTVRIG